MSGGDAHRGPRAALVVFSQRRDARVDAAAWSSHAERFFATRIGLAEDKVYAPGAEVRADVVRFVVAPDRGAPGVRSASARPREAADLALADDAEARAGGGGLAGLARRCETVWLVARDGEADALALRLAAILSSVLLGPIVDLASREIFGAKTARAKLEALGG